MKQENQFPELLQGKRLLYVHGFGGSAQGGTVRLLREMFPKTEVLAFDLPVDPWEAMSLLEGKCRDLRPDLIIGVSMGGMYAEQLHGYGRILVNPAFEIASTMRTHGMMGKQEFHSPRADGVQEFYVDKGLVKKYGEVAEGCFREAEGDDLVVGLFGDKDDLVDTFDLFREHYRRAIRFHGGHSLDEHALLRSVVPVVRWIDDEQEGRQRSIVFVHFDAMHDSYGNALSSVVKVVGGLAERYAVYFYAPCPTNDRAYVEHVLGWLEEKVSVLAYDRVVFTNQPELLYGDFFILPEKSREMMGTVIELGSDEFKTWEDVGVYFGRLGG